MSSCKKRKAEERTFFKKWEETYPFIENMETTVFSMPKDSFSCKGIQSKATL